MAQLIVRNIDEQVVRELKKRAAAMGRSAEAEHRALLEDEQKAVAERVKAKVDQSGKWKRPVVTEITRATEFYPAEDYHQDYLIKHPGGYNCHVLRPE